MHAPPKPDIPIATPETLTQYDAFIFGIYIPILVLTCRHPHSLRQLPRPMEGILGFYWTPLDEPSPRR